MDPMSAAFPVEAPQILEPASAPGSRLRILACSATWEGANDYSFVRAFRRAGHSVWVVSDETFIPAGWRHPALRALRRLTLPFLIADYEKALIRAAQSLEPDLFFVY